LNDIERHLEEDNDTEEDIWNDVHDRYDNGEKNPLQMQYQLKSMAHEEKVKSENQQKGEHFNYSRDLTLLSGIILTAATYKIHALFATTVIGAGYKIFKDSLVKIDGKDKNIYEKIDSFGLEFLYYLVGVTAAVYFFHTYAAERFVVENAGTVATATSEVVTLAQSII